MDAKETKDVKPLCGVSCIINASSAYYVVFCEKNNGHKGDHSFKTKDGIVGFDITIRWTYFGHTMDAENSAPAVDERCKSLAHVSQIDKMTSDCLEWVYGRRQFAATKNTTAGFICERLSEHTEHRRSGVYGPQGINWEIKW